MASMDWGFETVVGHKNIGEEEHDYKLPRGFEWLPQPDHLFAGSGIIRAFG